MSIALHKNNSCIMLLSLDISCDLWLPMDRGSTVRLSQSRECTPYAISRRRGGRETGKRTAGVSSLACSSSVPPGSRGERPRSSPGSAGKKDHRGLQPRRGRRPRGEEEAGPETSVPGGTGRGDPRRVRGAVPGVTFRTAAAFSGHLAGKYRTGCSHETVRLPA